MTPGLGRVQMGLLDVMERNSGIWPPAWKLNYRDNQLMLGLVKRGIVRVATDPSYGQRLVLTDTGRDMLAARPIPTNPDIDVKIDRRRKGWRT